MVTAKMARRLQPPQRPQSTQKRLTRSRAQKQGVSLPSTFSAVTPPDRVRRGKKITQRIQRQNQSTPDPPSSISPSPPPAEPSLPSPVTVEEPPISTPVPAEAASAQAETPKTSWTMSPLKFGSSMLASLSFLSPLRRSTRSVATPSAPPPPPSTPAQPSLSATSHVAPVPHISHESAQEERESPVPSSPEDKSTPQPVPTPNSRNLTPKTPIRRQLPPLKPMMTGRKRKIRQEYAVLQREKELRAQGLLGPESEDVRSRRREIEHTIWLMDAHEKSKRGEDHDDWVADESRGTGDKRKNVGKTFAVPDSESDNEVDEFSSETASSTQRHILTPQSQLQKIPTPNLPPPSSATPTASSPPRVGRTFAVPEYSSSEEGTIFDIRDSDVMSIEDAYDIKPVAQWKDNDYKDWLVKAYGFDPAQLAKEVPFMKDGEVPPMFMKAHWAVVGMRDRAREEIQAEMQHFREEELRRARQAIEEEKRKMLREVEDFKHQLISETSEEEQNLKGEFEDWRKKRAQVKANYNGLTLVEQVHQSGARDNNKYGFPYSSPDNTTLLDNVFAVAAANAAENGTTTPPSEIDRDAPPTPTPAHVQLPGNSNGTLSKAINVTWSESNQIHNHAAPGPNEPVKTTTPLPKSALKGRQLESLERKMSEATRYTPKQPSRLREVSEVAKPSADKPPLFQGKAGAGAINYQLLDTPYVEVREQLYDIIANAPTPNIPAWGTTDDPQILPTPYPEVREQVLSMYFAH
jgi:hypothetical protein